MSFEYIGWNCIVFGRVLRRFGLGAQPDRVTLFARALASVGFRSREDVKAAGRCVFVRSEAERRTFDAAFEAFWSEAAPSRVKDETTDQTLGAPAPARTVDNDGALSQDLDRPAPRQATSSESDRSAPEAGAQLVQEGDRSFTYSFAEALGKKDFSTLSDAESGLAHDLRKRARFELGTRVSRRTAAGRGGGAFDARRTLRASLRRFGELAFLHTRERRLKQRDIVLLCDISGSMDRYSRLLLQFIHAMRHSVGKVEAFVFGTRLTRITRQIRHRDINEALKCVAADVADWGGGTRIGESLRAFNVHWARRVLARGAIVIIISDGWDRGEIALLAQEMERLQRASYRLIWLNPLLGARNYRSQTMGMQAALPFIDDFLPAHNLASLVQLVLTLRAVDRRRPMRAQTKAVKNAV